MSLKVGQKVVAIRNHSCGIFKKGDVFTILKIDTAPCCGQQILDVGLTSQLSNSVCNDCQHIYGIPTTIWWVGAKSFVPITEDFQSISLTKILEKETPLIGVN